MTDRKPHVKVEQEAYLALLARHPEGLCRMEIADALDVSVGTAQRKLEGLREQGKVVQRGAEWARVSPHADLARLLAQGQPPPHHEPITGGLITGTCPHCGGVL